MQGVINISSQPSGALSGMRQYNWLNPIIALSLAALQPTPSGPLLVGRHNG
jgi:hypothetical protein